MFNVILAGDYLYGKCLFVFRFRKIEGKTEFSDQFKK